METALQNLAEGQLDAGCEVSLVTAGHGSLERQETIWGPKTLRPGRLARAAVLGVLNSQPVTPGLVGLLRREMALFRPDIVQLHLPNPLAAAAWLGLRATGMPVSCAMTVWYHADITRQRLGGRALQPLIRACLRQAAGISVSSQSLVDRSPVLSDHRSRVAVLPFGIASSPWLGVEPKGTGPFLFVGRLVPYKGLSVLFEALNRVPGAQLVIVGDGVQSETLVRLAESLGLLDRIAFVGTLDEVGIAAHLTVARALILPSIDASEAFGLVQLEAMGAGVPVITTDLPTGVPEVGVAGETGWLVPPSDPLALAAAMQSVLDNPDEARRRGQAGRARFEARFTRAVMTDRVVAWYSGMVAGQPDLEVAP